MQIKSKKYTALFLIWILLFSCGIVILKRNPAASSRHWIDQKLFEKRVDTAIKKLNMSMPTTEMYRALLNANESGDSNANLKELTDYYEQLVDAMPWMPEAHRLLGFCYYKNGDREKAFNQFKHALGLDPKSFYDYLNLSLMYLEADHRDESAVMLHMALNQNPRDSLEKMASSKVYQDILLANPDYNPANTLAKNYQQITLLLNALKHHQHLQHDLHIRIL